MTTLAKKLQLLSTSEDLGFEDLFPHQAKSEKPEVTTPTTSGHTTITQRADGSYVVHSGGATITLPHSASQTRQTWKPFTQKGNISSRALKRLLSGAVTQSGDLNLNRLQQIQHQTKISPEDLLSLLQDIGIPVERGVKQGQIFQGIQMGLPTFRHGQTAANMPQYQTSSPTYVPPTTAREVQPHLFQYPWLQDPKVMSMLRHEGLGTVASKSLISANRIASVIQSRGYRVTPEQINDFFHQMAQATVSRGLVHQPSVPVMGATHIAQAPTTTTSYAAPLYNVPWYQREDIMHALLIPQGFGQTAQPKNIIFLGAQLNNVYGYNIPNHEILGIFAQHAPGGPGPQDVTHTSSWETDPRVAAQAIGQIGSEVAQGIGQEFADLGRAAYAQMPGISRTGGDVEHPFYERPVAAIETVVSGAFAKLWAKMRYARFWRTMPVLSLFANDRKRILLAVERAIDKLPAVERPDLAIVTKEVDVYLAKLEQELRLGSAKTKKEETEKIQKLEKEATEKHSADLRALQQKYAELRRSVLLQARAAQQRERGDIQTEYRKRMAQSVAQKKSLVVQAPKTAQINRAYALQHLVASLGKEYNIDVSRSV